MCVRERERLVFVGFDLLGKGSGEAEARAVGKSLSLSSFSSHGTDCMQKEKAKEVKKRVSLSLYST